MMVSPVELAAPCYTFGVKLPKDLGRGREQCGKPVRSLQGKGPSSGSRVYLGQPFEAGNASWKTRQYMSCLLKSDRQAGSSPGLAGSI